MDWLTLDTLRWFRNVIRINEDDFVVYDGRIEGEEVRKRLRVKWIYRMEESWRERVGRQDIEYAEREWQNRERWRCFCHSHHPGGSSIQRK